MRARPATLLGLGLVVAALVALGGLAVTNAVVYYVTPTELAARPVDGPVRLYGIVVPGSVGFDRATSVLSFRLSDGQTTVAVTSRSLPTALFRDGIGVVLVGRSSGAWDLRGGRDPHQALRGLPSPSSPARPSRPGSCSRSRAADDRRRRADRQHHGARIGRRRSARRRPVDPGGPSSTRPSGGSRSRSASWRSRPT